MPICDIINILDNRNSLKGFVCNSSNFVTDEQIVNPRLFFCFKAGLNISFHLFRRLENVQNMMLSVVVEIFVAIIYL